LTLNRAAFTAALILNLLVFCAAQAQVGNPGRGGRGVPNATAQQSEAVARLNADLAGLTQRLNAARADLISAALAQPRSQSAIQAKADAVRAAELALANARADGFAKLQASPERLSLAQVTALAATLAAAGRGGAGGQPRTSMPHVTPKQAAGLTQLTSVLAPQLQTVAEARAAVAAATLAAPRDASVIESKVRAVATAELSLANARAEALGRFQAASEPLDEEQLAWLVVAGGMFGQGGFTEPEPLAFNDHRGYIPLFDGVSLKGWDGNPKFWRVEDGAIVGESTPENPSGNTYIAYRDVVARDFTLKFEMKVEGDGGSGFQYRSKTGIPWSRPIPANVTANVGPVNLNWMMTGPQADFWPSRVYTGQFYSENTPMGIMAWRGEVVEGAGLGAKRLMGTIGDRTELGKLVKVNDWNQYTVIARGGTFLHIVNGQLMAVMVDDDAESSNNQPGIFGIEIEATTKVSVRNIWLRKIN
jgi:hypothetical protein